MRQVTRMAVLLTALLIPAAVFAQDEAKPAEDGSYPLELGPDERISEGRAAFMQGEADATGHRFLVEGTQLDEPVAVSVFTEDPQQRVRVRIVKDRWDAPERDAVTADGRVDFRFRTYDGFKVWVTADETTPYQLAVWVGPEMKRAIPSAFTPASKARDAPSAKPAGEVTPPAAVDDSPAPAGSVSFSYLEIALALIVLLLVAVVAVVLLKRRPGAP